MHDRAPVHHLLHDKAPLHRPFEPLRWIGAYKLVKAALAIFLGVLALRLTHRDLGEMVVRWLQHVHLDPEGQFGHWLRARVLKVKHSQLRLVGAWFFGYSAVMITEGIGLMLRQRWAEWLTVVTTAGFIPVELYELAKAFTPFRVVILLLNIAVVWYLIVRIREDRRESPPGFAVEQKGGGDADQPE